MNTPWGSVGKGWDKIVQPLIDEAKKQNIEITQIKEKFGGLRFYVAQAPESFHDLIELATKESLNTCEECGAPGRSLVVNNWVRTICDPLRLQGKCKQ